MSTKILLGYEMGTGEAVFVPPSHLIVTGITQLSGKTTTLEALIKRSGLRAIIFKTKIGERVFFDGTLIPPFFREKSDWQYVEALLEATLREKMKFERSWIIDATKGTNSLFEVKRNIDALLANPKIRGLDKGVFTNLQAYLELVLPQLQYANFSKSLEVVDGINIMDLERFKEELQSLVIRSVIETVLAEMKNVIVVIPEAWKFLPQGRGNPVKPIAESFIRQGATNGNYLFIDSQDMAGIDKLPLKQVSTWILGLQNERNEVKHTLDQISVPAKDRPKVEEIMRLQVGNFVLVTPKMTKRVYVQPVWMDDDTARNIALGTEHVENFRKPEHAGIGIPPMPVPMTATNPLPAQPQLPPGFQEWVRKEFAEMRQDFFNKCQAMDEQIRSLATRPVHSSPAPVAVNIDEIVGKVLQKIPASGGTVKIEPREVVLKKFQQAEVDRILSQVEKLSDWQKQVLKFVEARGSMTAKAELLQRLKGKTSNQLGGTYQALYAEADELTALGFLKTDTHKRLYPNLAVGVKTSLSAYNVTDQDVNDVVGQILMRLS